MKNLHTFEEFLNESLNEGVTFMDADDLHKNWASKLKKPSGIHADHAREWDLYQALEKKKPHVGDTIKIQTPLFKYGVIKDKSYFSGPNKNFEVYEVTNLISNTVMKLERKESGGDKYTEILYVKDKGVYLLGGNGWNRDLEFVPEEYKKYID